MRIELLHVMMVHFTIGLLITGVVLTLVGDLGKRTWFFLYDCMNAGKGAIWVGALFGVLAVITGLVADDRLVEDEAIGRIVDIHETLAFCTLGVFAALAVGWLMLELAVRRLARTTVMAKESIEAHSGESTRLKRFRPWLHLLGIVGLGFILATGYYGGDMVYEHGAAVHRAGQPVIPLKERSEQADR